MSQTTQPMFLNGFLNACHNLVFIIIMQSVSLIDQYLGTIMRSVICCMGVQPYLSCHLLHLDLLTPIYSNHLILFISSTSI